MEPTASQIMAEVLRLQDQVTETRGEQITVDTMRAAVSEALRATASDPDFWAAASTALQAHAQREAGGWLFSWLKGLASKMALVVLVGMGVYALGGWSALAALFKSHQ